MNKYYIEDICVIEDFLTDEEVSIIMRDLRHEENWHMADHEYDDMSETAKYWNGKNKNIISDYSQKALSEILKRVEKEFDTDDEQVNAQKVLQRMFDDPLNITDWSLGPHADTGKHGNSEYVKKGYVIYYNDDYDGGEINYVNKGIVLKPKAKMLVCHPGSQDYMHGVTKVTNGIRYMTTGFIFDREYLKTTYS